MSVYLVNVSPPAPGKHPLAREKVPAFETSAIAALERVSRERK